MGFLVRVVLWPRLVWAKMGQTVKWGRAVRGYDNSGLGRCGLVTRKKQRNGLNPWVQPAATRTNRPRPERPPFLPSSSSERRKLEAVTRSYQLVFLSLAHNSFDGPVPGSLAGLTKLQELHLAGNSINGSIPTSLGSLTDLKALDLSGNKIAGEIPASLANLTATLQSFNVSYNNLSGAVPASLAQKFGPPSFAENILLCGYSASSPPCPVSPTPAPASPAQEPISPRGGRTKKELILIIGGIVVGALILLSLCCLLLCLYTAQPES